jgi:hypothetical protein
VTRPLKAEIPAIALTPAKAAASLCVSEGFFNEHIRPHLKPIRVGEKVLFAVAELERWAEANAETVHAGAAA